MSAAVASLRPALVTRPSKQNRAGRMPALRMRMLKMTELQPSFGDPTNDWAALYEIADVIRKAIRDPEFIGLANEPDTDKSSRVEGEDTPESAHMRCVAEEAINAVLNRIKIPGRVGDWRAGEHKLRPKPQIDRRQGREYRCRRGRSYFWWQISP
jgi:hypothetical protein